MNEFRCEKCGIDFAPEDVTWFDGVGTLCDTHFAQLCKIVDEFINKNKRDQITEVT